MLMFFGSVPSSGRPPLETTAFTSGKSAMTRATCAGRSWPHQPNRSRQVILIQIELSSSSGKTQCQMARQAAVSAEPATAQRAPCAYWRRPKSAKADKNRCPAHELGFFMAVLPCGKPAWTGSTKVSERIRSQRRPPPPEAMAQNLALVALHGEDRQVGDDDDDHRKHCGPSPLDHRLGTRLDMRAMIFIFVRLTKRRKIFSITITAPST